MFFSLILIPTSPFNLPHHPFYDLFNVPIDWAYLSTHSTPYTSIVFVPQGEIGKFVHNPLSHPFFPGRTGIVGRSVKGELGEHTAIPGVKGQTPELPIHTEIETVTGGTEVGTGTTIHAVPGHLLPQGIIEMRVQLFGKVRRERQRQSTDGLSEKGFHRLCFLGVFERGKGEFFLSILEVEMTLPRKEKHALAVAPKRATSY